MKKVLFSALIAVCGLLSACQSDDEFSAATVHEITFQVTNYEQYDLDDFTRASGADALDHLVMGVFDAATDAVVGGVTVQNKADGKSSYGTFSVSLPEGRYRAVFIGYNGNYSCQMSSSTAVSFGNEHVPHTFLSSFELTVDGKTAQTQNVVLKRAVAAFRVVVNDALPQELATFQFVNRGGGTALNAQTGFCTEQKERTYNISVPSSKIGKPGVDVNCYAFLPAEEAAMNITVNALKSDGSVIKSRTFADVPMKVNRLTCYTGNFFAEDEAAAQFRLSVDDAWSDTLNVSF